MSRLTDHRGERCSGRCVIRSRLVGARERAVAPTTVADQGRQASPHPALRSRQLPIQVAEHIHDRVRAGATRGAKFEIRSLTPFRCRKKEPLTTLNADYTIGKGPMRRLTQPWKLCRSFGSRPVGSVVVPRWPEAGITAQVIPTQPSSRTFRQGQSPTADLHTGFLPLLRRFPPLQTPRSRTSPQAPPQHQSRALPSPPTVHRIRRCRRSASLFTWKAQFPPEITRNRK